MRLAIPLTTSLSLSDRLMLRHLKPRRCTSEKEQASYIVFSIGGLSEQPVSLCEAVVDAVVLH
jgi:hypothetical protein